MNRLETFGKVRQSGDQEYSAGDHHIVFFSDGTLLSCG